jgi:acyl-CoA thioesterase-1
VRQVEQPRVLQAAAPPAPPPRVEDPRPKLVVFGDSITAGHGVEPGHAFPDVLQREADARKKNYHVVNAGVSGDTTANGLDRLPSVLALKPEIAVIELGGNDGLRGLPIDSTRANLEEMITRFQQAGAKVVLAGMTLPANYGPDYVQRFEKMYEELAAKHKVQLIPLRLDKIANGDRVALMQGDGIHPNKEGQRRLGAYIAGELFR